MKWTSKFKPGQILNIVPATMIGHESLMVGYNTYPGEYGPHKSVLVGRCIGVVMKERGSCCQVLIEGRLVWFEWFRLEQVASIVTS